MSDFTYHAKQGQIHEQEQKNHGTRRHSRNHNHSSVFEGSGDSQVIISRGMGAGAMNSLTEAGIEVVIADEKLSGSRSGHIMNILKNLNASCEQ
jgi:predicted Fe-Mo cluster-binding NifX family protein